MTMNPSSAAVAPSSFSLTLPDWMLVFAFVASLIWTIVSLFDLISRLMRTPSLDLKLTREVFLRILERGECLYANAVLVAHNEVALIKDARAVLKKTNGASKSFPLSILHFAEKYRSEQGLANYYFYSTSPLAFVPRHVPQRTAYICTHDHYGKLIQTELFKFHLALENLKKEWKEEYESREAMVPEEMREFFNRLDQLMNETCSKIMDYVQVEPGQYELQITLNYTQKGKFLPLSKTGSVSSSVSFQVDEQVRDYLRIKIKKCLEKIATNMMLDTTEGIYYPEYAPSEVKEL